MRDALPNALFIGLTGTPVEQNDANNNTLEFSASATVAAPLVAASGPLSTTSSAPAALTWAH